MVLQKMDAVLFSILRKYRPFIPSSLYSSNICNGISVSGIMASTSVFSRKMRISFPPRSWVTMFSGVSFTKSARDNPVKQQKMNIWRM